MATALTSSILGISTSSTHCQRQQLCRAEAHEAVEEEGLQVAVVHHEHRGQPPNKLGQDAKNGSTKDVTTLWLLMLNIPKDDFDDDMPQSYRNHCLLDAKEDLGLFELIRNYKALGSMKWSL